MVKTTLVSVNGMEEQFLTVRISSQLFGIPVLKVRDVLKPQKVTKIPLANSNIEGMINLRGRIVTVINMAEVLKSKSNSEKRMFVVVDYENDYLCLAVDSVGQTLSLETSNFEKNPINLNENWQNFSKGVFKLENELMLVLDMSQFTKNI